MPDRCTDCTCTSPHCECGNTYNLELNGLALKLNGTNLEVDTDGTNVALGVCVVGKPEQET
jgi:hypothetical protein